MKTTTKLNFIALFLLPFFTCLLMYMATVSLEASSNGVPDEEYFIIADESQDVNVLKKALIINLKALESSNRSYIDLHYDYIFILLSLAIFSAVCTSSIYAKYKEKASNN